VPDHWRLLPPGDAGLTRRVKKDGPSWQVSEKHGRKKFSRGLWAPAATIARIEAELAQERDQPSYQRKLDASRARRQREQVAYVEDFRGAVQSFLDFAPEHRELEKMLAESIAAHATPVGSGTVARTERISIERRAEAATIAWLRHNATHYDDLKIPRVKGMRREVRRNLAEQCRATLARYRRGEKVEVDQCPLRQALLRALMRDEVPI
jgi:hypothetical protein